MEIQKFESSRGEKKLLDIAKTEEGAADWYILLASDASSFSLLLSVLFLHNSLFSGHCSSRIIVSQKYHPLC